MFKHQKVHDEGFYGHFRGGPHCNHTVAELCGPHIAHSGLFRVQINFGTLSYKYKRPNMEDIRGLETLRGSIRGQEGTVWWHFVSTINTITANL